MLMKFWILRKHLARLFENWTLLLMPSRIPFVIRDSTK